LEGNPQACIERIFSFANFDAKPLGEDIPALNTSGGASAVIVVRSASSRMSVREVIYLSNKINFLSNLLFSKTREDFTVLSPILSHNIISPSHAYIVVTDINLNSGY
jgi:hypothetical protein